MTAGRHCKQTELEAVQYCHGGNWSNKGHGMGCTCALTCEFGSSSNTDEEGQECQHHSESACYAAARYTRGLRPQVAYMQEGAGIDGYNDEHYSSSCTVAAPTCREMRSGGGAGGSLITSGVRSSEGSCSARVSCVRPAWHHAHIITIAQQLCMMHLALRTTHADGLYMPADCWTCCLPPDVGGIAIHTQ